jgi:hypothetical protein
MKPRPAGLIRKWDLAVALAAAVTVALIAAPRSLAGITGELVTFFGIQAAALLPAMLLTATILRPEGLSPNDVRRYREALRGQMIFWSALLGLDFVAVSLVILGKVVNWSFLLYVPFKGWVDTSRVMIGVTAFVGSLAIVRMVHAVIGIFSLMKVNIDMVGRNVGARVLEESEERKRESKPFQPPAAYGRVIEPPKIQ